ncbi:MAG: response regulator [Deltaproteobacteria bacterium]|nr:response regulator [Deltaproteobacteria bacterium]MBW2130298.1 response regulator [Deltaproteobacteria bacterium]
MSRKILVMDDDRHVCKVLKKLLEEEGFTCTLAYTGAEAREHIKEQTFDLALCDIRLPDESGLDVARAIKDRRPETALMIITALEDQEIAKEALDMGVFGYLVKPFHRSQVLISVVNALRRHELEQKERSFRKVLEEKVAERTRELRETLRRVEETKEKLRESEEQFRTLVERSNDGIGIVQGEIHVYVNKKYLQIFGYSSFDEIMGKPMAPQIHPEDREKVYEYSLRRQRGEKVPERYRFRCIRKDGKIIHIEVSATRILYKGRPASLSILRDVTKEIRITDALLKKTRELSDNKSALQKALSQTSSLIQRVAKEKDFGIRFENPNLVTCYEMMDCEEKDCPCFGKGATRCWQTRGTFCGKEGEHRFEGKARDCLECPVFRKSCSDPFHEIGEHFNNMMHILEKKNLQLQEANRELKETQGRIIQQEKMASIGQLAAGIAHEINNPTGFINSNLGTLLEYQEDLLKLLGECRALLEEIQKSESTDNIKERVKRILEMEEEADIDFLMEDMPQLVKESIEGTERIKKIIKDLKEFAHPGKQELVYADINHNLDSTLNIVWNEIKYKATVKKDYGPIPEVRCYPQQLNQVFMNLLVNAAQAIEESGEITIKTREENGFVRIQVSDTGKGIPPEHLSRIFEPFFTTKEVGKGTGLGLHVAYDIVKKHGGRILVESTPGKGTTFTVELPTDAGEGEEHDEPHAAAGR